MHRIAQFGSHLGAFLLMVTVAANSYAQAVGSAVTFQGELRAAGVPTSAAHDFQFRMFNAANGGAQIGPMLSANGVAVTNGLFAVPLDFGAGQFAGDAQWLEIAVRRAGVGSYETLLPRTPITAAPYALGAVSALANSVSATSVIDGSIGAADVDTAQLQRRVSGSCPAGQYLRAVAPNGSVTCDADVSGVGTVTSVASGTGLTGGPITGSGTLSVAAGGIGATQINDAQVQRRVSGSCAAGQFMQTVGQDGTVACASDVAAWRLGGNAGTDPAIDFLGTTTNRALVLRGNNQRVAQFEALATNGPAGGFTANVLFGSNENSIGAGVRGATIAGGGNRTGDSEIGLSEENPNRVLDHYGSIGGGYGNQVGDGLGATNDRTVATVAGGKNNRASGFGSAIGGGASNVASEPYSTVAGGTGNNAGGFASTIGGGLNHVAGGTHSTIAGGSDNAANSENATVGGGLNNTATGNHSTIVGGSTNATGGAGATVGGGVNNCAGAWYSWAAGWRAKSRPGTDPGGSGPCSGLSYPGGSGDTGTFVWADFQGADFVSSGDNQFLVRASGGVGFNTNAPLTSFDVVSTSNSAHTALIRNLGTSNPSGLQIRLGVTTPTTASNFLTFERSDGVNLGAVEGNGAGGVAFNTSGGDYAEYLPKADARAELPVGSVVGIRGGAVGLDTIGADQLAVVSTAAAVSGNDPGAAHRSAHALIAFVGQVDVRVSGAVAPGDYLLASEANDGLALAIAPAALAPEMLARVVGRAWQFKPETSVGSVRALIGLSPVAAAQAQQITAQAQQIAAQAREIERLGAEQAAIRKTLDALGAQIAAQNRQAP